VRILDPPKAEFPVVFVLVFFPFIISGGCEFAKVIPNTIIRIMEKKEVWSIFQHQRALLNT